MNAQLQDRAIWLDTRRRGIGGSDVAAILGLSPWKSPLDVYLDKRGEAPEQDDNEAMAWGRALEPVIRQQYADRTGRSVIVPDAILQHPRHDFMLANLDGIAENQRVLEVKTARSGQDWGEPGTDEIPEPYLLQVQHYLCVTGYAIADVAVLIAGSDFRIYHVEADPELHGMLIEEEGAFWQRVIDANPPEPRTFADLSARFGRSNATGNVIAGQAVIDACAHLKAVREQIKHLEQQEADEKAVLMRALGDAGDALIGPEGKPLATWKLAKSPQRFDASSFKDAYPELHAQFMREGAPSRRLLLK